MHFNFHTGVPIFKECSAHVPGLTGILSRGEKNETMNHIDGTINCTLVLEDFFEGEKTQ